MQTILPIQQILDSTIPLVDKIVAHDKLITEQDGRVFTKWHEKCIRLGATYKLSYQLLKYIDDDAKIMSIDNTISSGAQITTKIKFKVNDALHTLNTRVIIASGQIQRAHYRYISNSSYKSRNNSQSSEFTKRLKSKHTSASKSIKLLSEIERRQRIINSQYVKLHNAEQLSFDDILDKPGNRFYRTILNESFESFSERKPPIFDTVNTKQLHDEYKEETRQHILSIKSSDIRMFNRNIELSEKLLKKLQKKFSSLHNDSN